MSVSIVKTDRPADARKAVELLGGMGRFVSEGDSVIVKPNICAARDSDTGTVTSPEIVAEICRMVSECGGSPVVADSPIYPFKSSRVFRRAGYGDFEREHGFPILDLDSADSIEVRVPSGRAIDHSVIPRAVLTCDKLINVPVMKTHLQTTVTMGLKNLKGVVVGKQKHVIHLAGLDEGIVDLNTLVQSDLTVMDGIIGMEGTGGPTNGRAVRMDVIVAGDNVVETDSIGTRLMGGDPEKVDHLRLAVERGLGPMDGIEILGDSLSAAEGKRDLPRNPGLNRVIISGLLLRLLNLARTPLMWITGGDMVSTRVEIGDLVIDYDACDGCRQCIPACPVGALSFEDRLECDREMCIRCFCCAEACPRGALSKRF